MATNNFIALLLSAPRRAGAAIWPRTVCSLPFRTSSLAAPAAAIVFAILLIGNPLLLFASATSPPAAAPATPAPWTPTPSLKDSPQIEPEVPASDEIAAAFDPANDSPTETGRPPTGALLTKFQAWATEEDARSAAEPAQPGKPALPPAVQNDPSQLQLAEKHRQARSAHKSRARVRPMKNVRGHARVKHNARAIVRAKHITESQTRLLQNDGRAQNTWTRWSGRPLDWLNRIGSSLPLRISGPSAVFTTSRPDDF